MEHAGQPGVLSICGLVIATDWTARGVPRRVAISTAGEQEYDVQSVGAGKQLIAHLRKQVVVLGVLVPNPGRLLIEVRGFQVVAAEEAEDSLIADVSAWQSEEPEWISP